MGEFSERMLFPIVGPPHGGALCWVARVMSFIWVLFLMFTLILGLANGGIRNPFLVLSLIGLATAVAGLKWHVAAATSLTSAGIPFLGALLLHDPVELSLGPSLLAMALTAGGIVNILAWFNEREWGKSQLLVGLGCGLPGMALCVLGLWSYSGLGDDCEWGQGTMMGGISVLAAVAGLVLFFAGLFLGMWFFGRAWHLWHENGK